MRYLCVTAREETITIRRLIVQSANRAVNDLDLGQAHVDPGFEPTWPRTWTRAWLIRYMGGLQDLFLCPYSS